MYLPSHYQFSCSAKINSGIRALEQLPQELDSLNARRPLILADNRVSKGSHVKKMISALRDSGMTIGICDNISDVSDIPSIEPLTNLYRSMDHDSIVAIGSGSIVDVAKVLNITVSYNSQALKELVGDNRIMNPLGPFVLVPKAGSDGYETSRYARMQDMKFYSDFLMPDLVLIDPRMVTTGDTEVTIASAMTALTHAVEAYTSPQKNPIADTYAYAAIQYVAEHVAHVATRPVDRSGNCALANAACMAGCIVSEATRGVTHVLGETIALMFNCSPGLSMGVLLPYTVAYRTLQFDARTAELLLPLAGADEYAKTSSTLRAAVAVTTMIDLQYELHEKTGGMIPRTLEEADIPEYMLQDIAEKALSHELPDYTFHDYLTVLQQAWKGTPAMKE